LPSVQFGGLITGLDTSALISGLVKAEHQSVDILQNQKLRYQAQSSVLGTIVSALANLKSAAQSLSLPSDFSKRSASSSDTSVLTASADSTAQTGASTIMVDRLAKARMVKSATFTSAADAIGTGTLTLTVNGTNTAVTIDGTNNTLTGLKNAINSSGAAVTASIVNAGTEASPDYRLVVQSKETGSAKAVTIAGALAGGADPFVGGGEEVQAAADALFSVNGLTVTRASNTVSDVIPGVTFVLLQEGDHDGAIESTDATAKLTVSADSSSLTTAVKSFADSYNAVNTIVNGQFTQDSNTKRQGALAGDASIRGVMARLRSEISRVGGIGAGLKYLSDIGVKFQKDGSLSFDEAVFADALQENPDGVAALFTIANNGIGKRVPGAVDDYISTVDGALIFRQKGIQSSIDTIDKKVAREEERIAAYQARLTQQFKSLEQLVSQLKSQGDYLTQQLTALSSR
jgi:flagellar hook-associated protein 2